MVEGRSPQNRSISSVSWGGTAGGQILAVQPFKLVDTFFSFDLEYLDDVTLSYLKVLLLSKLEDIQEGVGFSG